MMKRLAELLDESPWAIHGHLRAVACEEGREVILDMMDLPGETRCYLVYTPDGRVLDVVENRDPETLEWESHEEEIEDLEAISYIAGRQLRLRYAAVFAANVNSIRRRLGLSEEEAVELDVLSRHGFAGTLRQIEPIYRERLERDIRAATEEYQLGMMALEALPDGELKRRIAPS